MALLPSIILVIAIFCYVTFRYLKDPLNAFPGPSSARLTNFWRLLYMYRGQMLVKSRELHRQYGSAVRIGPNYISLSDVNLIKTIYASDERFRKGDFYVVGHIPSKPPTPNIFSEQDPQAHQKLIKPVLKLYSANRVDQFEPLLNQAIDTFVDIVRKEIQNSPSKAWKVPMERWIDYFTWDAMSTMTFSKPLGFLTQRKDVGSLLSISQTSVSYMSVIGCIPILDKFLSQNPIHRIGPPAFSHAAAFSFEQIAARSRQYTSSSTKVEDEKLSHPEKAPLPVSDNSTDDSPQSDEAPAEPPSTKQQIDFLDHFLSLRHAPSGPQVTDTALLIYLFANVVAGSDTVAAAIASTLRHLLLTPQAYTRLKSELHDLNGGSALTYRELKKLPYLSAAVTEGMRLLPSIGMHLERVVPPEGLVLADGRIVPGGTLVGINAGVVQRDEQVFGREVEAFRPERWLQGDVPRETEEEGRERVRRMKAGMFQFGYGKRGCLGKELALMEIYGFVARVVGEFEMEITNPHEPWKVFTQFFVYPSGTEIAFRERKAK